MRLANPPCGARGREAAELLGELLAVPSEGWHALAAAMSQELFDGLKRWHAACLAKNRPVVLERHPVIAVRRSLVGKVMI